MLRAKTITAALMFASMAATSSALAPGECSRFTEGEGEIVLCIKDTKTVEPKIQVVNGFLYNSGKVKLCNVKLGLEGANGQVQAFWPDWAANAAYEIDFQPGQLTETGVTQSVEDITDAYPTIKLTNFEVCGTNEAFSENTKVETLPLDDVELPGQQKKSGLRPATPINTPVDEVDPKTPAATPATPVAQPTTPATPAAPAETKADPKTKKSKATTNLVKDDSSDGHKPATDAPPTVENKGSNEDSGHSTMLLALLGGGLASLSVVIGAAVWHRRRQAAKKALPGTVARQ